VRVLRNKFQPEAKAGFSGTPPPLCATPRSPQVSSRVPVGSLVYWEGEEEAQFAKPGFFHDGHLKENGGEDAISPVRRAGGTRRNKTGIAMGHELEHEGEGQHFEICAVQL